MSRPALRLYGYWRSSSSWRVRIALALKELDWRYEAVHLLEGGGEQHRDEYRRLNPQAQVPTLEIDEGGTTRHLGQSLAICRWLDERFPDPPLVPRDAWLGAKAWQLAEIVNAGIQPFQNLAVLQRLEGSGIEPKSWAAEWIARGLGAMEREASGLAATYLVGEAPSIADLCLVPQLYAARRFRVDLDPYPTLLRVEKTCEEHPAFRTAHPDAQPDAQTRA